MYLLVPASAIPGLLYQSIYLPIPRLGTLFIHASNKSPIRCLVVDRTPSCFTGLSSERFVMARDDIIETDELRAFATVAATGSFSRAAGELGSAQSTVSQQVARLEKRVGRLLIRRTTRRVELTPEGTSMLIYAQSILAMADDARRLLSVPPMQGVLRLGFADEFATTKLSSVLAFFCRQHPHFEMQFMTGRNDYLYNAFEKGMVDIILGKCPSERKRGELLWRERLLWVGQPWALSEASAPVPLVVYLRPSETRDVAEAALLAARRPWTVVAQGDNLLGLLAAVEAGLGVTALGQNFVPSRLSTVPSSAGLPELGTLDFVIERHGNASDPGLEAFAQVLRGFAQQLIGGGHGSANH